MALYYKYMDAVQDKIEKIALDAESQGGDWIDNVKKIFEDAERYHFEYRGCNKSSVRFHYHTSKNDYNLVSFNLWKENREFKCNFSIGFPQGCSAEKQSDIMYDVFRDCLEDLEDLEKEKK